MNLYQAYRIATAVDLYLKHSQIHLELGPWKQRLILWKDEKIVWATFEKVSGCEVSGSLTETNELCTLFEGAVYLEQRTDILEFLKSVMKL